MAAVIRTRINENYNRINIVETIYPERKDVEAITSVEVGRILEKTRGFPASYEPPGVSFKTFRSLCNFGLKRNAEWVLRNRKRSFCTPNYVWNGIMAFGRRGPPRLENQSYQYALGKVRALMKMEEKLPILSIEDAASVIPGGTSPGLPWINMYPGMKKRDVLELKFGEIKAFWMRVGRGEPVLPLPDCAAFARTHISTPDKNKVRPVWAYPLHAVTQEAKFSTPILEALKKQEILVNTAYGMEMMKGGMAWLHTQAMRAQYRDPGAKFLMTDFSAFDSSVPAWLIRDAFDLIKEKLDFSRMRCGEHIMAVDEKSELRKFRKIVNYFINTTVRNSDGRRFLKYQGVPSGSMFTNIIDTIVNLLVTYTIVDCTLDTVPLFEVVFGDDGIICLPSTCIVDIDALSLNAMRMFGMTLNVRKTYATRNYMNIHFLGYYNYAGTPVKQSEDLIASMLYPQYEKDDWSYCISRALGCILAAAGTSTDVFLAGKAVWDYASRFPETLERGIALIRENPRSRRFLDQMGCGELPLSSKFFEDINMAIPDFSCSKLRLNIQLVDGVVL